MYTKLYESLVTKVGKDAARAGIRSQYAGLGLVLVGLVGIVISYTANPSWLGVVCMSAAVFIAVAVEVYMQILFARSISANLGIRVGWLELPLMRISTFDEWIESVKRRSQSSNKRNRR